MGKPHSREEAVDMLECLSGREHKVITAVTLRDSRTCRTSSDTAIVHFKKLSESEIGYYVDNYKPYDKAGGYGIQGSFSRWVSGIDGCYFGVVGLPANKLSKLFFNCVGAYPDSI